MKFTWAIITGEYPPQPGGVSDYTQQVTRALIRAGDEVHVFAPSHNGDVEIENDSGAFIHRMPDNFGRLTQAQLEIELKNIKPDRMLLQYVPHAYGYKAMNVPFCYWLWRRRRRDNIWAMFHEVAYPFKRRQPMKYDLLAIVTNLMALLVARASRRIFVSTPRWSHALRPYMNVGMTAEWLPVPSNVPSAVDFSKVLDLKKHFAKQSKFIIGHFSSIGAHTAPFLREAFPAALRDDAQCVGLLIGRGGGKLAEELIKAYPSLRGRLLARSNLSACEVAQHLAACDVLIQPYPDGMSGRRTSAMAGLALGVPIVTNQGAATEDLWSETGAVELVEDLDPRLFSCAVERLLNDEAARVALGARGRETYALNFDIAKIIGRLRE